MAEAVTAKGREILTVMLDFLRAEKAEVIEMDTDGIYFVAPPAAQNRMGEHETMAGGKKSGGPAVGSGVGPGAGAGAVSGVGVGSGVGRDLGYRLSAIGDSAASAAFLARMQERLPAGIEVELDAVYPAMFSYKSKNYALLDGDGRVSMTGAALKSRGLEPFQRRYIQEVVTLILTGRGAEAGALFAKYAAAIKNHAWPVAEFAQRETLSASPQSYADKLVRGETRRSAAYELALKATTRSYAQGDQVAFYLTGSKKNVAVTDAAKLLADADPAVRDENVAYYLDKLEKTHAKFAEFLPAGADPMPLDGLFG
jgi:DNA polymerase elongation subunit (family B)